MDKQSPKEKATSIPLKEIWAKFKLEMSLARLKKLSTHDGFNLNHMVRYLIEPVDGVDLYKIEIKFLDGIQCVKYLSKKEADEFHVKIQQLQNWI